MSENLTPEVLADLKAKALKATPGPWFADTRFGCEISGNEDGDADDYGRLVITVDHVCSTDDSKRPEDDRAYIIAAQPARVLSLLTALEEAEGREQTLRQVVSDAVAALDTGGFIKPDASIDFMQKMPLEIETVVKGLRRRAEKAEQQAAEKDDALLSAAKNLDACAVAIRQGGKGNGRHILVEGWAERARASLSPNKSEADSNV